MVEQYRIDVEAKINEHKDALNGTPIDMFIDYKSYEQMDFFLKAASKELIDLVVRGFAGEIEYSTKERYVDYFAESDMPEVREKMVFHERDMNGEEKDMVTKQAQRIFEEDFTKVYLKLAEILNDNIVGELKDESLW